MKLRQYQRDARDAVLSTTIGQVIAPTGTGKSVIQGSIIESLITNDPTFSVYVILTPRIMLTNQLMRDVSSHLLSANVKLSAFTIHSGDQAKLYNDSDDDYTMALFNSLDYTSVGNSRDAITLIKDAQCKNKPLLICCTYDSTPALTCALNELEIIAKQVLCDEAHYIVEKEFHKNIDNLKEHSDRIHFFTATQKITASDNSNGMNNSQFYGPVVFRRTPREMFNDGYMVRPRLHLEKAKSTDSWATMVADAFTRHQLEINFETDNSAGEINAKMLVCCKGTKTVKSIVDSVEFHKWCKEQDVTLFAITSAFGAFIDQAECKREVFLDKLRNHVGKAIILHIGILTEGIDVPDISGVMFFRNMGTCKFLQSLGRATRVLSADIGKPVDNFDENSKLWVKPYAYAIIAARDDDHEGITADLKTMVEQMRVAGFEPLEEVVISVNHSNNTDNPRVRLCNETKSTIGTNFLDLFDAYHDIELKELASLSDDEFFEMALS